MTHDQPMRRVRGQGQSSGSGPVRAVVRRLRRNLDSEADNPTYFFTKGRGGYRMEKGEVKGQVEP